MAGSSLFLLLDDIATLLDDVASLTKIATKKTAAVLGDDLAVNAHQVTGVSAERELPIVWAVAKGSFKNKLILVPSALLISAFIPWLIIPLLICGGIFLCFEGFETVWHFLFHKKEVKQHHDQLVNTFKNKDVDLAAFEKEKIQGAIRTDFILSAEIIVISLGVVSSKPFITQSAVLATIAIVITVGVYGLVAGIVKIDDFGLYLSHKKNVIQQKIGLWLVCAAPVLMKALSVFGTLAMFLVGGGIVSHNIDWLHHPSEELAHIAAAVPAAGSILSVVAPILFDAIVGIMLGGLSVAALDLYHRLFSKNKP
ncbi:MAG: putative DNA repair protein MutK [Cellvibrionaceae bacterium]|jgi:predicted DNA repair protein MutK